MAVNVKAINVKKLEGEHQSLKEAAVAKRKIRNWIEDLKQEVYQINWTTKAELRSYTQIVVGGTFLFGIGVYIVDLVIHAVIKNLTAFSLWLFG